MGRVTRAEAARQLGLDKSTITRWVKKHPALLDAHNRVSVAELERHRDTVVNPALQTRKVAAGDEPAPSRRRETPAGPSLNDQRARSAAAKATSDELDLADRLKMTLRREEVEAAVAEAGDLMRQKAAQLVRDRAEALAMIDDTRAMERALDEMMREFLASAARALASAAAETEGADAA